MIYLVHQHGRRFIVWYTNMAAVTSCENETFLKNVKISVCRLKRFAPPPPLFHSQQSTVYLRNIGFVYFQEAIGLLEPMTNDPVNYVRQVKQNLSHTRLAQNRKSDFHCERDFFSIPFSFNFFQGALIASSLVLIQQTELSCPKVAKFREIFAKVISDKHEDVIAKFGATLAQGILDAGKFLQDQNSGQSVVISTMDPKPANTAVSLAARRKERRLDSQAVVSKNTNQFSGSILLLAGVLPHCCVRSIQMSLIIRVSASKGCLSY